jgi:hypothetical protein
VAWQTDWSSGEREATTHSDSTVVRGVGVVVGKMQNGSHTFSIPVEVVLLTPFKILDVEKRRDMKNTHRSKILET